jgi:hypothetical protein
MEMRADRANSELWACCELLILEKYRMRFIQHPDFFQKLIREGGNFVCSRFPACRQTGL